MTPENIVKDLSDKGKIMEAGFLSFRLVCIAPDAPAMQLREMRIAFMAGAQHLWSSIMSMLGPEAEPTDEELEVLTKISNELAALRKEFGARDDRTETTR